MYIYIYIYIYKYICIYIHLYYIYITLLNFVKLSTLLIKNGSHKQYATLTTLTVV